MKKLIILLLSSVFLLGITGCGSNNEDSTSPAEDEVTSEPEQDQNTSTQDEATSEPEQDQNTSTQDEQSTNKDSEFDFIDFELEVEYADNKEYEADYELENNQIEAKIEDDLNEVKLKDNEALEKLEPILKDLQVKQDTSKQDAINEVINAFNLPEDYHEFELKITFDDQTEVEFEDKK